MSWTSRGLSSAFAGVPSPSSTSSKRKQASPMHPAAQKGGPCGDTWTGAGLQKEPGEALGSPTPIQGRGRHQIECPGGE
ncbi:unnamed protein product [Rangifer tarandus platyrhynchus]|uniref:Uncharacterized protein n=1 Tax=Rangifer tarandus platyrhynchus TaxID=3082113 RepID=A0AC59Z2K0_RANTA